MPPKRNELSIEKRKELIRDYQTKQFSQRDLVKKYGVSLGSVNSTLQSADKYMFSHKLNPKAKRFKKLNPKNEKLNQLVVKFIQISNAAKSPIDGPLIKNFASEVANSLQLHGFKCSNGWLQNLNKRFGFRYKELSGESGGVNEITVNKWKTKLSEITAGYDPENVYNFDETALFYKLLPKKTYTAKGQSSGMKKLKQRITIGLCCLARGDKLKPLVIGKAEKPRCFRNIGYKINKLGVHYFFNTNSWMTQTIFEKWLKIIDKHFRKQKRHILLFVDNFSGHDSPNYLTNVIIRYFPSNTTSRLQPLDQGVIRSFKSKYRRHLMNYLSFNLNQIQTQDIEGMKNELKRKIDSISLKETINWLTTSWTDVSEKCITNCFIHSGFAISSEVSLEEEEDNTESINSFEIMTGIQLMTNQEIESIEESIEVTTNDWRQDLLNEAQTFCPENSTESQESQVICLSDCSDVEKELISKPSFNEAIDMIEKIETLVTQEVPEVMIHLNKVKNALIETKLNKKLVQKSITDYFKQ